MPTQTITPELLEAERRAALSTIEACGVALGVEKATDAETYLNIAQRLLDALEWLVSTEARAGNSYDFWTVNLEAAAAVHCSTAAVSITRRLLSGSVPRGAIRRLLEVQEILLTASVRWTDGITSI